MVEITVYRPKDCSAEMLEEFCKLVLAGGEVQPAGLAARVKGAAFLAFANEPEGLVGVAALKTPTRITGLVSLKRREAEAPWLRNIHTS
jgi:hypothetical protein